MAEETVLHNLQMPRAGQGWRHYKGNVYKIVGTGWDAETGNAVVVYHRYTLGPKEQPHLFSRSLSVFLGMTKEHEPRFLLERE